MKVLNFVWDTHEANKKWWKVIQTLLYTIILREQASMKSGVSLRFLELAYSDLLTLCCLTYGVYASWAEQMYQLLPFHLIIWTVVIFSIPIKIITET
jgi:hypothetical protein